MKVIFQKLGFAALALFAMSGSAKADDPYGRFLLCDTKEYNTQTHETKTQRFFNAAMGTVKLEFGVYVSGRSIIGSGYAHDGYGTFQLRDSDSGEIRSWSGVLKSAHQVERQFFNLSMGHLSIECQYGIPVGP